MTEGLAAVSGLSFQTPNPTTEEGPEGRQLLLKDDLEAKAQLFPSVRLLPDNPTAASSWESVTQKADRLPLWKGS